MDLDIRNIALSFDIITLSMLLCAQISHPESDDFQAPDAVHENTCLYGILVSFGDIVFFRRQRNKFKNGITNILANQGVPQTLITILNGNKIYRQFKSFHIPLPRITLTVA